MKTALDRADRLSTGALKGFHKAHAKLTKANSLLEAEESERAEAAKRWQAEVARYIKECEDAQKAATEAKAKNERRIAKIADFLEI